MLHNSCIIAQQYAIKVIPNLALSQRVLPVHHQASSTLDSSATPTITTGFNTGPVTKTMALTANSANDLIVLAGDIWQDVVCRTLHSSLPYVFSAPAMRLQLYET
jgi:hypothetical protein